MAKHYIQEKQEPHIEEMEVGDKVTTRSRVITPTDIEMFASLTGSPGLNFLSAKWAQSKGLKDRVTPGLLTFSLAMGLLWQSGFINHVLLFMGADKVRFLTPVYPGDSIRVEAELLSKKPSKTPDRVICTYKWRVLNQENAVAVEGENTCLPQVGGIE